MCSFMGAAGHRLVTQHLQHILLAQLQEVLTLTHLHCEKHETVMLMMRWMNNKSSHTPSHLTSSNSRSSTSLQAASSYSNPLFRAIMSSSQQVSLLTNSFNSFSITVFTLCMLKHSASFASASSSALLSTCVFPV